MRTSAKTRLSVPVQGDLTPLGHGARGLRGVVASVGASDREARGGLDAGELERRLLEIGFVEGAQVEILHEGAIGGDPIAVRLDDMRVALRRREADAVMVRVGPARLAPPRHWGRGRAA